MRKDDTLPWLRLYGKSQLSVEYFYERRERIDTIFIRAQHAPEVSQQVIRQALIKVAIQQVLPPERQTTN